jgi:pyrimidine-nucleoside phosphorylase
MIPAKLIARKRNGEELDDAEIDWFLRSFTAGELPDYQMSAMAMAIYFQGMSLRETVALTRSLLESGKTLDWGDAIPKVDKHSTGGIGDKISLVLAPILACCGVHVPMISGRGLGITGGTLDKLESVSGFRTDLSITELQAVTHRVGCVITGASDELAPADRKLYALRDVTGTVPSRPLIVASILSKKLAEGLQSLVFDVKVGSGAFMKNEESARLLANDLAQVGHHFGLRTTALLTDMDQPLGRAIGNAIEVQEAITTLQGGGPADVLELTIRLGSEVLNDVGVVESDVEGHRLQLAKLRDGSAYAKFEEMIVAQGGRLNAFTLAPSHEILATQTGYVHCIDAARLGNAVIELGGGRRQIGDTIDHGAGLECLVRVGSEVAAGQPLMRVYARGAHDTQELAEAISIHPAPVERRNLIIDRIKPC